MTIKETGASSNRWLVDYCTDLPSSASPTALQSELSITQTEQTNTVSKQSSLAIEITSAEQGVSQVESKITTITTCISLAIPIYQWQQLHYLRLKHSLIKFRPGQKKTAPYYGR